MTKASLYLIELARKISDEFIRLPTAKAAMMSGSAAQGISDEFSNIDMMIYYETLPTNEEIEFAISSFGRVECLWTQGSLDEGAVIVSFRLKGVECQVVHTTVVSNEAEMMKVLSASEIKTPLHKLLSGTLDGIALHGEEL